MRPAALLDDEYEYYDFGVHDNTVSRNLLATVHAGQ